MRSEIFRPSPAKNEGNNNNSNDDGNENADVNSNNNDEKSRHAQQQQQNQQRDGCSWERVGKEQHPLGTGEGEDPFPFRPTSIDTAMLLQSAARSVLDSSPGSTTASSSFSPTTTTTTKASLANQNHHAYDIDDDDDGKSSLWMMDNHHIINNDGQQQQRQRPPLSLQSLETKTLAAMPDFQDRRRFLGCLAAVLASAYDHDVLDEEHDDIHQATRAETVLFHDDEAEDDFAEEDEELLEEDETESENIDDNADFSDGLDDDNGGDDNDDDHPSLLQQTVSGSFEFSDVGDSSSYAPQRGGGGGSHPQPMHSPPRKTAASSASSVRSSPPRQQQQQQDRMLYKHANKIRLSRSRHLKRRYDVLTRLLISSADYLMLEKSQAKAFVPMMARILVPKQKQPSIPDKKKQRQQQPPQQSNNSTSTANNINTVPSTPTNSSTASSTTAFTTTAAMANVENTTIGGGAQKPPLWKKSSFSPSGTIATVSSTTISTTTMNMAVTTVNSDVDESSQQRRRQQQALLLENLLLSPESAAQQSVVNNTNNNNKIAAVASPLDSSFHNPTTTSTTTTNTTMRTDDTDNIPKENEVIILQREISEIEHLQPFLESMTRGGAFRCLVLVLLQHLLTSPEGYDARIRHALKTLGVIILVQDIMDTAIDMESSLSSRQRGRHGNCYSNSTARSSTDDNTPDLVELATRRFESLEHWIAANLIDLSREQEKAQHSVLGRRRSTATASAGKQASYNNSTTTDNAMIFSRREQIMRGVKVGAVGVVAASLFAVTAGLAAPGIAAAAAALASGTAATAAAAAVLTSTPAVISIFGVGGGTLVAYKMNRRTKGLTEFVFRKENAKCNPHDKGKSRDTPQQQQPMEAELFSTICISGWLRDKCDFQRPWGVAPSNPWITNREELLQRFYAVHRPEHVSKCKKILKSWEGEEMELWNLLRQKYGRDPDTLFPLEEGPRFGGSLTLEQKEVVDRLFVELGCTTRGTRNTEPNRQQDKQTQQQEAPTPFERMRVGWKRRGRQSLPMTDDVLNASQEDQHSGSAGIRRGAATESSRNPSAVPASLLVADGYSMTSSGFESNVVDGEQQHEQSKDGEGSSSSIPKHLATVWDYQANYGGELYTVRWESQLLTELCDSVTDLAFDVVTGGTAQILKHTALSTLLSAIAWPYALVNAANMIDETWTLAVERADEAGRELARSLLFSRAGHRPVTLVGFSFGARTIYSCLKELAKYQEKWSEYRERTHMDNHDATAAATSWSYNMNTPDEGSDDFYKHMREPASIVEDAVLMGLPNHLSLSSWKACRQVVSGRLVNCFSQKDLILSLMFQFKRMSLGLKPVCGTCSVAIPGVENIDVSDLVSGHIDYCMVTGDILKRLRFQQPFRSRPTKTLVPDASPQEEEVKLADKFDV